MIASSTDDERWLGGGDIGGLNNEKCMKTEHRRRQIERFIKEASRHESSVNFLGEKMASNASIGGVLGHFTITIEIEHIKIDNSKHEFKVIP